MRRTIECEQCFVVNNVATCISLHRCPIIGRSYTRTYVSSLNRFFYVLLVLVNYDCYVNTSCLEAYVNNDE